jgi:hypothetical protein
MRLQKSGRLRIFPFHRHSISFFDFKSDLMIVVTRETRFLGCLGFNQHVGKNFSLLYDKPVFPAKADEGRNPGGEVNDLDTRLRWYDAIKFPQKDSPNLVKKL